MTAERVGISEASLIAGIPKRAYTVSTLAREWECSEGVIRKLVHTGELGCFRLGVLIRIPAEEVRRFECQSLPSSDLEGDMPSFTGTNMGSAGAGNSTPAISLPRKPKRAVSGNVLPAQPRRSAG